MRIHFVGIGGIGVSALARYYLNQGQRVSGSDLAASEITQALQKMGAVIQIGKHKASNLYLKPDVKKSPTSGFGPDLLVYSPAILQNNPELAAARQRGIRIQSYPEALGELTKKHFTIAVCGTHGKGTTTALISLILIRAGLDPTVIIGTRLKEFNDSNFRPGRSKYLVIEADEYQSSFLNYWPKAIVLTTIDKDHLDYFKTLENIIKAFASFVGKLPKKGILIVNKNDVNSSKLKSQSSKLQLKTQNYSLKQKEASPLRRILKVPGEHIVADALAALTLARTLKISDKVSFAALAGYRGAWRRFEEKKIRILTPNSQLLTCNLISDYAHHPTEVEVTLRAVREKYPKKQIWCVFQPHQYQRTYYLFDDFVRVLSQTLRPAKGKPPVDKLILTDIYSVAGREDPAIKKRVSSPKLAEAVKKILDTRYQIPDTKIIYIPTLSKTAEYLKKNLLGQEILVVMGAGDIYKLPALLEN